MRVFIFYIFFFNIAFGNVDLVPKYCQKIFNYQVNSTDSNSMLINECIGVNILTLSLNELINSYKEIERISYSHQIAEFQKKMLNSISKKLIKKKYEMIKQRPELKEEISHEGENCLKNNSQIAMIEDTEKEIASNKLKKLQEIEFSENVKQALIAMALLKQRTILEFKHTKEDKKLKKNNFIRDLNSKSSKHRLTKQQLNFALNFKLIPYKVITNNFDINKRRKIKANLAIKKGNDLRRKKFAPFKTKYTRLLSKFQNEKKTQKIKHKKEKQRLEKLITSLATSYPLTVNVNGLFSAKIGESPFTKTIRKDFFNSSINQKDGYGSKKLFEMNIAIGEAITNGNTKDVQKIFDRPDIKNFIQDTFKNNNKNWRKTFNLKTKQQINEIDESLKYFCDQYNPTEENKNIIANFHHNRQLVEEVISSEQDHNKKLTYRAAHCYLLNQNPIEKNEGVNVRMVGGVVLIGTGSLISLASFGLATPVGLGIGALGSTLLIADSGINYSNRKEELNLEKGFQFASLSKPETLLNKHNALISARNQGAAELVLAPLGFFSKAYKFKESVQLLTKSKVITNSDKLPISKIKAIKETKKKIDKKIATGLSEDEARILVAQELLGKNSLNKSQTKAILDAHYFGISHNKGVGPSDVPYTLDEIREKTKLLTKAFPSSKDRRILLENGISGFFGDLKKNNNYSKQIKSLDKLNLNRKENFLTITNIENNVLTSLGLGHIKNLPNRDIYKDIVLKALKSKDKSNAQDIILLQRLKPAELEQIALTAHPSKILIQLKEGKNPKIILKEAKHIQLVSKINHIFESVPIKFPYGQETLIILKEKILPKVFPSHLFPPPKSITVNNLGMIKFDVNNLSDKALDFIEKLAPKWEKIFLEINSPHVKSAAQRTQILFNKLGIEDSKLLRQAQRADIGEFSVQTRAGWEQGALRELYENVHSLKVKDLTSVNNQAAKIKISPEDIPDNLLENISEIKNNYSKISANTSRTLDQARVEQKILYEALYKPDTVKLSLKDRSKYVPDNSDDLELLYKSKDRKWKLISEEELSSGGGRTKKQGYSRNIYRNEKDGISILETKSDDGSILSQELIVARDINDPTKGVAFFSYENGKLSSKFRVNPTKKSGEKDIVGFDCMACHSAKKAGSDSVFGSFSPVSTPANDKYFHPSIKNHRLKSAGIRGGNWVHP